jgi:hypothetical protein
MNSSSNFKQNYDKIIEQEKISNDMIDQAIREKYKFKSIFREDIILKERERCKKEIRQYDEDQQIYLKEEIVKVSK